MSILKRFKIEGIEYIAYPDCTRSFTEEDALHLLEDLANRTAVGSAHYTAAQIGLEELMFTLEARDFDNVAAESDSGFW